MMLLAGGSLMAQSQVTVNATPVAGEKNAYTLAISPYNSTMENALTELKGGSGNRGMFTTVTPNASAQTVKVVLSDAKMTEENLEVYLKGYLDYKAKGAPASGR